jgi:hypothetical protein
MRIYARWVKIVRLLKIPIFFLPQPRPVDGPQLAWEQIAIKPLSDRYQPISSRYFRRLGRMPDARDSFFTHAPPR